MLKPPINPSVKKLIRASILFHRSMTTSKRVQDRSKQKRVNDLEVATEKWKILSKILFLIELLKQQPEMIIPVRSLENYRKQINLPKPHRISDFIRKTPKLFELYKDHKGVLWCGLTERAEELLEEEQRVLEQHSDKAVEHVTRLLMMSVDKRLPLEKIAHFRRDFGLPMDFRANWVHQYPQHFRVVKFFDGINQVECLELVNWNPNWSITELEKVTGVTESTTTNLHIPGMLSLPFPLKFPSNYKRVYRYSEKIQDFQKRAYLSPYADARGLRAGCIMMYPLSGKHPQHYHDILSKNKYLRVLSFGKLNIFPDSIDKLIHLRYLDLSWSNIEVLSESLCKLYNLQTLKLEDCSMLTMLPNGMYKLVNLRHLDIRGTPLKEMPKDA